MALPRSPSPPAAHPACPKAAQGRREQPASQAELGHNAGEGAARPTAGVCSASPHGSCWAKLLYNR